MPSASSEPRSRVETRSRRRFARAAAALSIALAVGVAEATAHTWINADATAAWETATNWNSTLPVEGFVAGDIANLPATPGASQLITISTPQTLGEMRFASGGALGYTLAVGATLNLDNLAADSRLEILSGPATTGFVAVTGAGPIQYSTAAQNRSLQIVNNQPVVLTIAPSIATAGTGGITVSGVDGSSIALDGLIGPSVTGGMIFNGTPNARLSLAAGNSYTGGVTVTGGVLRIGADSALGAAANGASFSNTATLEVAGIGSVSTARALTFTGAAANLRILNLNEASGLSVNSVLGGSAKVVKTGLGTLTLANASNNFSGGIDLIGGTVAFSEVAALGNTGVITFDGGGLRYTSGINQTLARTIDFAGAGTIAVDGQFAELTLGMSPTGSGTLTKTGAGSLKMGAALPTTLSLNVAAGTVDLSAGAQSIRNLTGSATLNLGASNLVLTPTLDQAWSGNITGTGSVTKAGSRTLTLTSTNGFSGGLMVTGGAARFASDAALGATNTPITLDGGALQPSVTMSISRNLTLGAAGGTIDVDAPSLTLAGRLTGGGALIKTGAGNLLLTNTTNAYTGGTVLRQGTLLISDPTVLGSGGLTLDGGALDYTGAASATLPGALAVGAGGGTLHVPSAAAVLTIGAVSGGGTLIKTGDGPLQLAPGASFSGPSLQIDDGTFDGASNALAIGTLTGSGTLAFGSGTLTLTPGADTTFAGLITGSGPIIKNGPRTLTLGSPNAFAGALTINAGTVAASSDEALGVSSASITLAGGALRLGGTTAINTARSINVGAAGGTLDIQNSGGLTLSTAMSATGAWTKAGPGPLTLLASGAATSVTVAGGELRLKAFGALSGATSLSVLGGSRFVIEQTPAVVSSGRYSGAMALRNGEFSYLSAGAVQIPEVFGALTLSGVGVISATPGAAGGTSLQFSNLVRDGRAALFLRGNVGGTPGPATVNVGFTAGVTGISDPAGGNVPINLPVVPYGAGSTNVAATTPDTFLTSTLSGEVRPLDASEYFAVSTPGAAYAINVNNRLTASPAALASTLRVNSLVIAAPVTLGGTADLQVHSGAVLNTAPLIIDNLGLNFVTAQGYLHMGASVTLQNSASLMGIGGVSVSASPLAPATLTFPDGTAQGYFGGLFVNGPVTVAFSNDNHFGGSGDALSLAGGTLRFTPAITHALSPRAVALQVGGGTFDIQQADAVLTVPGIVSGAGSLTKAGAGKLVLGGVNTYSGTTVAGGTLSVPAISALGAAGMPLALSNATLQYTGATATLSQPLALQGAVTVDVESAAATLTVGAAPTGSGSLTKSGAGTLKLSPGMTLPISSLHIAGGTVDLDGNAHTLSSLTGTGGLLINSAALTLDSNADVSNSVSVGGTGSLVKRGSGTLTLGGTSTYSGGTRVLGGTLAVTSDASLGAGGGSVELDGATLRYALGGDDSTARTIVLGTSGATIEVTGGVLSSSGAIRGLDGLRKTGAGTLRLTGAVTHDYFGPTTILDGAIDIAERRAILPVAALTLGEAGSALRGRLLLGGSEQALTSLTIHATPAAQSQAAIDVGTGSLTLRGDLALADTQAAPGAGFGAAIVGQEGAFLSLGDAVRMFNIAGSSEPGADLSIDVAVTRGGIIFNGLDGAGGAPAVLELKQPGTYALGTIVQQGTLITRTDEALGTGNLVLGTNGAAARAELGGTQTLSGLATAGTGSATLHSDHVLIVNTASDSIFAGVLSGAMRFNKRGAGALILGAGNLHTGGTGVEGGTLVIPADSALGDVAGGVSFNGGTLKLAAQFDLAGSRPITLDALGGTLDTNGFDTTLAQSIAGPGGLGKLGSGKLVLAGSSTYAGVTTIGEGVLEVRSDAALGASSGGTLLASGAQLLLNGPLNSPEPLTLSGAGPGNAGALRSVAGANALSGQISTAGSSATISVDAGSSLAISGTVLLGGAGTRLTLAGAGDGSIASGISPTQTDAGLTKTGPGTWTLSGANGYRGSTIIEHGTLVATSLANSGTGNFSSLGTGANLTLGSSALQGTLRYTGPTAATNRNVTLDGGGGVFEVTSAGTTLTLSGPIIGASLLKTGAGTLKLTGTLSFQGNTTVSEGTLEYAVPSGMSNVGTTASLTIAPGATVVAGGNADPFSDVIDRISVVNNGTLNIASGLKRITALTGPGGTTISGDDTMLQAHYIRQQTLAVGNGTLVEFIPNGINHTSRLESLNLSIGSRVDLQDNDLIVQATPATREAKLAQVEADIARARGIAPDLWLEFGLTSSFAAMNPLTTLAAVLNDDGQGQAMYPGYDGIALDTSSILVKYTWNGDANADGRIDIDDYFRIDVGYALRAGLTEPLFAQGDFDYDGDIDADDYFLIDAAFLGQAGPMSAAPAAPVSVPEPGAMAVAALAGMLLKRRRR